ncbi:MULTISPECIES: heme transporter [unclassified Gordonia (in: high G+C Gram-positive bacteria)]|uniref:heme transporter n=1 Tax=Gordonia TaxID=2053 RepID=UPI00071C9D41|nr:MULTISPECIES: heme transporter [unclassified Gordonia (in: high G+C Gram-positive bacteria)]KSU56883.1 heme transporter [Gordonia sp. SGD-V-85]MBR7190558.1 heme transporter [Gordonia sp. SCSIO 19800]SCC44913.1 putative hemin transport protein [Gordonia sp. v-85]
MTHSAGDHPHARSDLEILLRTAGFAESSVNHDVPAVAARLPGLAQVVGVTVAGPVIMNAVGVHDLPTAVGGPLRVDSQQIALRLNPSRLSSALLSDPAAHVPPTLRLFDHRGNTAHATYLTENSDRLAFEAMTCTGAAAVLDGPFVDSPAPQCVEPSASIDDDQVAQFDAVLTDGGVARLAALPHLDCARTVRVETRAVIAALEHAAGLGMTVTFATAAPGCIQMRQDRLDGAREHRGQMVLASGSTRVMINFDLVGECWVTWPRGVWDRSGSLEIYSRGGECALIVTQTGAVAPPSAQAWQHLAADLAG